MRAAGSSQLSIVKGTSPGFDQAQRPHRSQKSIRSFPALFLSWMIDAIARGIPGKSDSNCSEPNTVRNMRIGPTRDCMHSTGSAYPGRVDRYAKNSSFILLAPALKQQRAEAMNIARADKQLSICNVLNIHSTISSGHGAGRAVANFAGAEIVKFDAAQALAKRGQRTSQDTQKLTDAERFIALGDLVGFGGATSASEAH